MRPFAQILKGVVFISADDWRRIGRFAVFVYPAFFQTLDQLKLKRLAGKESFGLGGAQLAALKGAQFLRVQSGAEWSFFALLFFSRVVV